MGPPHRPKTIDAYFRIGPVVRGHTRSTTTVRPRSISRSPRSRVVSGAATRTVVIASLLRRARHARPDTHAHTKRSAACGGDVLASFANRAAAAEDCTAFLSLDRHDLYCDGADLIATHPALRSAARAHAWGRQGSQTCHPEGPSLQASVPPPLLVIGDYVVTARLRVCSVSVSRDGGDPSLHFTSYSCISCNAA